MATLLQDPSVMEYDILAIQEPWRNPFLSTTHHPAKDRFHLCYPEAVEDGPARVCFFVNKRLDNTKWQFESHTKDVCSLHIRGEAGIQTQGHLHVHNIYNPGLASENRESVLPLLCTLLERYERDEQVVLGDFNLHHRSWGGDRVVQEDQEAEELIFIMERFGMTNTLQQGVVTYAERNAQTTIDLCWITLGLLDRLIKSEVDEELDHDSDHFPITTMLNLSAKKLDKKPKRNWKRLDDKKLCEALRQTLPQRQRPRTKTALDQYTTMIAEAIDKAVEEVLPRTRLSPKAREGWNDECTRVLAESKRLRRAHCKDHTEESWEAYRAARNRKARIIRKALQTAHREKVAAASDSLEALWKVAKWAKGRETLPPSVTPSLRCPQTGNEVTEASEKTEVFRRTFFPRPPAADLGDMQDAQYAGQISLPPITEKEILEAIKSTSPLKAPGPDGLPNRVLQAAADNIVGHLTIVFNQSLHIGYCPAHFRSSTTVVLRKPGKDNYTIPKAYRPIALLNTIGKIMDAVMARRLSYLVETYHVLPNTHIGGRKLRSTEHALHMIIERIYKAWNSGRGKVASLLLLDVSGAFDNVSHERLLHNLRTRRVDEKMVLWITSFLGKRQTRITMDDFTSEEYAINTGIPQGSPLSPIFYIFYNAGLLETCELDQDTTATGYIDDAAILACGDTTSETCEKLKLALEKAQHWASTHASKFAPDKFQLTHFTRSRTRFDTEKEIETEWGNILPSTTCKYLGVVMDQKLNWKSHIEEIRRKVSKSVNALASLGSSTWGVRMSDMRKIYRGVVVPQMMYACSVWSNSRGNGTPYTGKTLQILRSLQARGARAITGAFRATSSVALDVEAHLLPVVQQIERHNTDTLGRIMTCQTAPELDHISRNSTRGSARMPVYTSPLRNINRRYKDTISTNAYAMETISPFIAPPWWRGPATHIDQEIEARSIHDREIKKEGISIYTDGSCIGGHVGAAAVYPETRQMRNAYMGTDATSTVYVAELEGINLALTMADVEVDAGAFQRRINIFVDNQAAIRSLTRPEGRSGAYILKQIAARVESLQEKGHIVVVRWIPSHEGIEGNEAADIAAKEATGWREGPASGPRADPPPKLYALQATLKMWSRKEADKMWETSWQQETKGRTTFRHTPAPSKKVLQLHEGLTKRQSAILVQLRTEKIGLRDFLFRRKVPNILDPMCTCQEGRQTVRHILLTCRKLRDVRRQELGHLPEGNDLRAILSKRKVAIKAIKLIERTQILGQSRIVEE
ncbi:hypothetical protein KC331_g213 [Hortaea werneckii]|nr:hypothetical protein KC361_g8533 [Hortaea werneckii]KAI6830393.1 hypothetical protein KC342_g8451 [Hortaea werneckii]KAI6847840.1 hypothetical protein KC350_g3255 [Hortaea werneckii]KAI7152703.1 hypothetical protein KC349_g8821 [Hortaea werneckii]KAI7554911.1 hypothetical protein KC331_g213 [Hortaea werneckii]